MKRRFALSSLLLGLAFAACDKPGASSGTGAASDPTESGRPQVLPRVKLWLGAHEVSAEIARSPVEHQVGMMWRTNVAEMEGMIFVFTDTARRSFWMRNTLVPLDIAYLASDGTLLDVHAAQPRDESPVPSDTERVQFVLEMKLGWFQSHNVKPGMQIRSEKGTLQDTFFLRP